MNVEQRLIEVFKTSPQVEPTPDLYSRVVHSIDEDRLHRRRVRRAALLLLAASAAVATAGAVAIVDDRNGRFVHRPTMEALEAVVMLTVLAVLGPAIRRFGRNYAADLWPRGAATPAALLRLLDLAYALVGVGYILLSTEFEFTDRLLAARLPEQLGDAAVRIGGLLLLLGVLHASMLFLLPLVALVANATRRALPVPRWIWLVMVIIGAGVSEVVSVVIIVGLAG